MSRAVTRAPRREAQMLRAMQARARGGIVEALTAELARDIGLETPKASVILTAMTQSGLVENLARASRTKPGRWRIPTGAIVEANRPRGPAPGTPAGMARHTAAAAILFDWIAARLDDDGVIEIGTREMAEGVGVGVSTVETLLARWKAIGAVAVLRRGGPRAFTRWRFDVALRDAAAACAAVHPSKTGSTQGGGAARGQADGAEPPLRAPGPVRTRCPFCEMPPHHADCRHGWDGATTRGQRRHMALAAAAERAVA